MPARVASADETRQCEQETIESGTSSALLMRRAGEGAAALIGDRYSDALRNGALVYAGPGNNGGDAWVVAQCLADAGHEIDVVEIAPPRSAEATDAKSRALAGGRVSIVSGIRDQKLIVDGLLGTGTTGSPRGDIARAVDSINSAGDAGACIVSLDLPTGLDATTGGFDNCVRADATITFGVVKRGHLVSRDVCGEISVVDIGLKEAGALRSLPVLVDDRFTHEQIPPIPASAHKGTRKRIAIVGGGRGMAGAAILSGEGALRSGAGLLRIVCHESSVLSVHAGIPASLVSTWPDSADDVASLVQAEDCIAIGPGFGNSDKTRDLAERILLAWSGPVVLDADALNIFAGDVDSLMRLMKGRDAVLTPHPAELGRLLGMQTEEILADRFRIGADLSQRTGAAVLLKGSPTIVFAPDGRRLVIASGTAALATGGSGDVLTGIIATLLAQMPAGSARAINAAACGAFIHGRAAELCGYVRGITLADVLEEMPRAWNERPRVIPSGIIAHLEARS